MKRKIESLIGYDPPFGCPCGDSCCSAPDVSAPDCDCEEFEGPGCECAWVCECAHCGASCRCEV